MCEALYWCCWTSCCNARATRRFTSEQLLQAQRRIESRLGVLMVFLVLLGGITAFGARFDYGMESQPFTSEYQILGYLTVSNSNNTVYALSVQDTEKQTSAKLLTAPLPQVQSLAECLNAFPLNSIWPGYTLGQNHPFKVFLNALYGPPNTWWDGYTWIIVFSSIWVFFGVLLLGDFCLVPRLVVSAPPAASASSALSSRYVEIP